MRQQPAPVMTPGRGLPIVFVLWTLYSRFRAPAIQFCLLKHCWQRHPATQLVYLNSVWLTAVLAVCSAFVGESVPPAALSVG